MILLIDILKNGKVGEDVLKLNEYKKIKEEVADPKQYNVGFATRLLLANSFSAYFRDEGDTTLYDIWVGLSIELKKN